MAVTPRRDGGLEVEPLFPPGSPSAGLAEFLAKLKSRIKPRLYDVGPAPGGNIVFFAGRGLRVYVDADRDHRLARAAPDLGHLATGDFEAAVLWDVIDFLSKEQVAPFARDLARIVSPGGLIFLLSSSSRSQEPAPVYTFFIELDGRIVARPLDAPHAPRIRRENRDLAMLFDSFETVSVHLLRSGMREILLKRR